MFGKGENTRSVFLFAVPFAPVLACLEAAQIGFVLLIGIVAFMVFETEQPFLAGAALIRLRNRIYWYFSGWPFLFTC